jgi:hypothetical protein
VLLLASQTSFAALGTDIMQNVKTKVIAIVFITIFIQASGNGKFQCVGKKHCKKDAVIKIKAVARLLAKRDFPPQADRAEKFFAIVSDVFYHQPRLVLRFRKTSCPKNIMLNQVSPLSR